nr:expressed conserved protein [Hymenolepis microstoma]
MASIIKVTSFLLIALPLCLSLDCYKCRNCSKDPSTWKTYSPCGYCSTETLYVDNRVKNVDRKCTKSCQNLDAVIRGNGLRIECCKQNFCNSAISLTLQSFLPTILILTITSQLY